MKPNHVRSAATSRPPQRKQQSKGATLNAINRTACIVRVGVFLVLVLAFDLLCGSARAATNTIVPGLVQTGTITNQGVDVYTFAAVAGDRVTVYMQETASGNSTNDGAFGPAIDLIAPSGSIIAQTSGGTSALLRNILLTNGGVYSIVCRDSDGVTAPSHEYGVSVVKLFGPNASDDGETNALTPGVTIIATNRTGDLDVYFFSGTAGQGLTVFMQEATFENSFATTVELYSPAGVLMAEGTSPRAAVLRVPPLASSGTYSITCRDSSNGYEAGALGRYGLTILSHPGTNAFEVGETNRIVSGVPAIGTITAGDLDAYLISAAFGDALNVVLRDTSSKSGFDPSVAIYSPRGVLLAENARTNRAILRVECLAEAGDYLVVCRDTDLSGSGLTSFNFKYDYVLSVEHVSRALPVGAPPEFLQIIPCGAAPIIRWSTNATGFRLQSAQTLTEPASSILWSNVPPPYPSFAGFHVVTNQIAERMKLFRLIQP